MTYSLFIDDERWPIDATWADWYGTRTNWVVVRNWTETYDVIKNLGFPNFISFDHDLGDPNAEPSGFEIAKMLVEFDMDGLVEIPDDFDFCVHSKNPIGKTNIEEFIRNYTKQKETR